MNGLFIATILDKIKWNDETAQEPKRAISVFPSLIWEGGEGGQGFPFILSKIAILDKIKGNSKAPSPPPPAPQIKDEAAQEPKRAIFPSLIWEEGGQGFPFILSKIVGKNNPGLIIRMLLNKRKGHRN